MNVYHGFILALCINTEHTVTLLLPDRKDVSNQPHGFWQDSHKQPYAVVSGQTIKIPGSPQECFERETNSLGLEVFSLSQYLIKGSCGSEAWQAEELISNQLPSLFPHSL